MKILVICKPTAFNFLRHYALSLTDVDVVTKVFLTTSIRSAREMIEAEKPDILLLEWANDLTSGILLNYRPSCRVVVRVHDHEVTQVDQRGRRRAHAVNWAHVDNVWFINRKIMSDFKKYITKKVECFYLPNAIDETKFTIGKKKEKIIGLVSLHFRERKAIHRAAWVARVCPEWSVEVLVHVPSEKNQRFYDIYKSTMNIAHGLSNFNITHRDASLVELDDYPFEDINRWYQDKAIILSTSKHEGFHYAIGEAMLTGAMPVVWPWKTAGDFWSPYVIGTGSLAEAQARIDAWSTGNEQQYRSFVIDNFSPRVLVPKLLNKMHEITLKTVEK